MRKFFVILFLFSFLFSLALTEEFKKAPNFSVKDLEGSSVTLSKELKKNDLILISFWSTTCGPCKLELKELSAIYDEYKDKGLQIFAVNEDGTRNALKVKPFVKSQKMTMPVLLDKNGSVKRKFSVKDIPNLFIINNKREIIYEHRGYTKGDEKEVLEIIKKNLPQLKEKKPCEENILDK